MLLGCITAFRGEVYALLENGDILSTNIKLEQRASTVTMAKIISAPVFEQVRGTYKFYLVESDGDLLLVLNRDFAKGQPVLYWVDTENRSLEAVVTLEVVPSLLITIGLSPLTPGYTPQSNPVAYTTGIISDCMIMRFKPGKRNQQ